MTGGEPPTVLARVVAVINLVGAGEWTTYGEVATVALGMRGARMVGRLAARGRGVENAHRILLAGGRIAPGGGEGRGQECRRRLESEGIVFRGEVADPARHVRWLDLEGRLQLANQLTKLPNAAFGPGESRRSVPSASVAASTRTSEANPAIRRGGKLKTQTTWRPCTSASE